MTIPKPDPDRRVDKSIDIAAPLDAVWNALTDADELARWFPLGAKVEPGAGGRMFWSWGESCEGWAKITIWEPGRHLQISEQREPVPLTTDFTLETLSGDATRLRIVTAGFTDRPGWEAEFDSINAGWRFEMAGLRHYLEHHRGRDRQVIWIQRSTQLPREQAFPGLLGPDGLLASGQLPAEDEPFAWTTRDGDELRGRAIISNPPIQFAAVIENLNRALLRVEMSSISPKTNTLHAWLWLSAYDVPAATLERLRASWESMADRLLPNA